ncbi:MAG: ribokinase [Spirochaetes bacterium GWB1_59_5]|nr:MAG: ribokinase [Spirochaetes bacterium GWB1_59_5]
MHSNKTDKPICVVGSINYDLICVLDRLPELGETLTAQSHVTAFGGKGANQAVAAARLGAPVRMIGAIGSDPTGVAMRGNLEANGIDAAGLLVATGPSGVAMINIDANGDNTIVVYPGANAALSPGWVRANAQAIESSSCLMLQLETPLEAVLEAARIAAGAGVPVLLNPAPARQLPDELLALCTVVTPNETELDLLTGAAGIEAGARLLLSKGVGAVVVTLGSKGCFYMDEKGSFTVPSYRISAVDATAAGDSFSGALATRLRGVEVYGDRARRPLSPEDLEFCNAAGALAATKLGAQPSIPPLAELEIFMARQRA